MDVGGLPDVIILEIFRYLPYAHLCKAAQVCSRWRRISQDKSLHKVIDISKNTTSWYLIYKFIKFHCTEDLVDLSISINDEPLCPPRRVAKFNSPQCCLTLLNTSCPNLKYLSLDQSAFRLNLYNCIKYLPNSVTHFSLQDNSFHGIFDEYTDDMKKLNVECLVVSHSTFLTIMYMDFLDCFPNLRVLYMNYVDFDEYNILHCPVLKGMGKTLRILNLEGNSEYEDFYLAFDNCVALEELYLGDNQQAVDDEILQDGPELPNLHTLCVLNTDVKLSMDVYLKKFPKLKTFLSGESEYRCNHFVLVE